MVYKKYYILIFLFIVFQISMKKYNSFLPTIPIYPNNQKEILIVQNYVNNRSFNHISLFQKTDLSIVFAFVDHVNESLLELHSIITSTHILFFLSHTRYFVYT